MMQSLCVITILLNIFGLNSAQGENSLDDSVSNHCGNIFFDKQFVLTSENYPISYPKGKDCFYLLKGGNCTTHFNIEFLNFDLPSSLGCTTDRLEIGHQDAVCGRKNGSRKYYSEQGSLTLKFVSSNKTETNKAGFRLLVTRIDVCKTNNSIEVFAGGNSTIAEDTTESIPFEWTTKIVPINPRPTYLPPKLQGCCQNYIYSGKSFLLVSPNFPSSVNTPTDCTYTIRKTSSLVCRLRINVLFFALGPPTRNSCPYGHLEIDGKYICGCNLDVKLTTNFGESENKFIKFYSAGYNTNYDSGFVLEVFQDECQKRYSPEVPVIAAKSLEKFRFYKDQFNRVKWPQHNDIDQLNLVKEESYSLPPEKNDVDQQFGNVYKHFYFFAPEEEEDTSWTHSDQEDREETDYIEISSINTLLTNLYRYEQCLQWNKYQLNLLKARYGESLKQMCIATQQASKEEEKCVILSFLSGSFSSPRYPLGYPANSNVCYRFNLLPGYCAIQAYFKDFQVEGSFSCLKDYLAINQYRYCGNYLANKQVTISARGKSHQDLKFVSDINYCGKGFSAVYRQVQCQETDDNSITTPVNCSPGGETTDESPINCRKVISSKHFIIRDEDAASMCTYDITKHSENTCKVVLYLERFNLPCHTVSLEIDGRVLCGERTGQSITLNVVDRVRITYTRYRGFTLEHNAFLIRGEQTDCEKYIPDPVKLMSAIPKKVMAERSLESTQVTDYHPDVCALLKRNVTTEELPLKICEVLTKNHNITECNYSRAVVLDLENPTANSTKIRLYNEASEVTFTEDIYCEVD